MRLPAVESRVSFKRHKIYDTVRKKQFPAPIKLGRITVWLETEIAAWMSERINAARG